MASASRTFGFETTTGEVLDGLDLTGRVAVVTGASGGLGAETARALASKGAAVTIGCRDVAKGEAAAEAIRTSTGNDKIAVAELDLLSHDSIRRCAREVLASHPKLDLLIDNAGVMACPLERSSQGWELQFATNHVGHFLFTALLVPALEAASPSRVVVLSSAGHQRGPVDFDDLHFERKPYEKWEAYGQAKSANALFAVELDRRLRDRGVRAFAVHPGAIGTELSRHLTRDDIVELLERVENALGGLKAVEAGAATSVWAATAPELDGKGGIYLEDCGIAGAAGSDSKAMGFLPHAVDPELAARLWSVTEELLGERFDV